MTLIQDVNEDLGDLFGVPDLLGVDEPPVTVEEISQSQEVFDEELPLLHFPDHSPKVQPSEISPSNEKGTPSGARMLVKNYMPSALLASPADPNSQMIANEATGDHQTSMRPHQDIRTLVDSSPNEIPTPVRAIIAESDMSEFPPTPSPVDSKSQVIVEGDANYQPTPIGLPQDIETLVDAYIKGIPIVLIAPREKLPIGLRQDYGWVILGFYQVTAVTVS